MTGCQAALCTVLLSTGVLRSPDALQWNNDYGKAKQAAQASRRPMIVILENPEDVKQRLDIGELSDRELQRLKTDNYELCRVDVTTTYGKEVAKAFGATKFPYTAVTDDISRTIVFRKVGQMSELDWSNALAKQGRALPRQPYTTRRVILQHGQPFQSGISNGFFIPSMSYSRSCFT